MPVTPSLMMPIIASLLSLLLTLLMPGQQPGDASSRGRPERSTFIRSTPGAEIRHSSSSRTGRRCSSMPARGGHSHPRGQRQQRPDASRAPGEWIARYILRQLAHDRDPHLDYGYITHFHDDHMGGFGAPVKNARVRRLQLLGRPKSASTSALKKMIDRGWPDYNFPVRHCSPTR